RMTRCPALPATARAVASTESTAARMLVPYLKPDRPSVSVTVNVTHLKPKPPAEAVEVSATFLRIEYKLWTFGVVGQNAKREVRRARHQRDIVEQARLDAAAAKRKTVKLCTSPT
ncbi:hypothetical protein DOTSEDRAFT_137605, partial [Dothistroma septosporum NZE10]